MKTFSQFLNELYLCESRVPDDYEEYIRSGKSGTPKIFAQMSDADFNARFGNNPKAQFARDIGKEQERNRVTRERKYNNPTTEKQNIKKGTNLATSKINPQFPPESMIRGAQDAAYKPQATPRPPSSNVKSQPSIPSTTARKSAAREKLAKASAGMGPSGNTIITPPPADSTPLKPNANISNNQKIKSRLGRIVGPGFAALDTALSAADERSKGSGWARSLAKGATVAAGGALGGTLGAIGGGGLGSAALGIAGATAGGAAAEKAFDVAAGANARERAAMMRANRMRQSGSSLKGIGGSTTFSQKKPGGPAFMSTGAGSQRRTVQLAKTGEVHRGGQSVAGHLAFKGGKAVYKAGPSAQTLAKTSSNPLERIGRTLFAGAYKKHDVAKAQQALQRARQSDAARNLKLK